MENIKTAIRRGIVTDTTKAMLEEAEAKIAQLEAGLAQSPDLPAAKVTALPSAIKRYLKGSPPCLIHSAANA